MATDVSIYAARIQQLRERTPHVNRELTNAVALLLRAVINGDIVLMPRGDGGIQLEHRANKGWDIEIMFHPPAPDWNPRERNLYQITGWTMRSRRSE